MKDIRPDSKVTLEDLLRLKRAEKPDAAFWTQFEQKFRARQLAAAVEKKRWWHGLPRLVPGLLRFSVPVGATAVLAITFVTVRHSTPTAPQPIADLESAPVSPSLVTNAEFAMSYSDESGSEAAAESTTMMVASNEIIAAEAPAAPSGATASSAPVLPSRRLDEAGRMSPSARLIAANMADAEKEFANLLYRRGSEVRVVEEPLAQIPVPAIPRSSRVMPPQMAQLAGYSLENERSSQVTERQARRLSEDQFYDAARRLSAQADRLMLKL